MGKCPRFIPEKNLEAKNPEASPGSVSLSKVTVTGEKGRFGKYRRIHTHLIGY